MSYTYQQRKLPQGQDKTESARTAAGPDLNALMTGAAKPSAAQKGRPFDLDAAMKAKMEHAFGDLSAVKLYESPTVGQAGAEAIAQGNEIAFAPGMADFSSRAGQERLGHELSHVMSQRSGAVRGRGFLASSALEARADREGAMAAAGQQVCAGPVGRAVSDAAPASSVAGAMQAKKDDTDPNRGKAKRKIIEDPSTYIDETAEGYDTLDPTKWEEREKERGFFAKLFRQQRHFYKARIDRRAYEMTPEELRENRFNPNNVPALTKIQDSISKAGSTVTARAEDGVPQEVAQNGYMNRSAWMTFQQYNNAGDSDMYTVDDKGNAWDMNEVDHTAFTNKLKNMSRMVRDYPELNDSVGRLVSLDQEERKELKTQAKQAKQQTTVTDSQGNVQSKKKRARLKREKGKAREKIQPAPMAGYQPNLNWQKDDIVDPGWVPPKKDKNEDDGGTTVMTASYNSSYSSDHGYDLSINAGLEGSGNEARKKRREMNEYLTDIHGTTLDYAANHELGHMLNYNLIKEINRGKSDKNQVDPKTQKGIYGTSERYKTNKEDVRYHVTANRLVEKALRNTMSPEDYAKLVRYEEDSLGDDEMWDPDVKLGENEEWSTKNTDERFKKGQINLKASGLGATKENRGYTTGYGATNAAEFFAEAFADVYQNGKEARPTSIELVKLYEKNMDYFKRKNAGEKITLSDEDKRDLLLDEDEDK